MFTSNALANNTSRYAKRSYDPGRCPWHGVARNFRISAALDVCYQIVSRQDSVRRLSPPKANDLGRPPAAMAMIVSAKMAAA
jgi:hypothetical protein